MAKAAVGQICSSNSMAHNLEQCVKLVGKAASAGAKVRGVLLLFQPMISTIPYMRPPDSRWTASATAIGQGTPKLMSQSAGTSLQRLGQGAVFNTTCVGLLRTSSGRGWMTRFTSFRGLSVSLIDVIFIPLPMAILFLPEASDYIATSSQESMSLAKPVASSPFVTGLQSAAAKHSIAVHVGIHVPVTVKPASTDNPAVTSIPQPEDAAPSDDANATTTTKLYNRTIYITPTGSILESATYNKLHLFDYPAGGLHESASTQAGAALTPPVASPVGRLGSLICFDVRFAEPALALAQPPPSSPFFRDPAQVLLYPSACMAHWEVLLRARAVETQSYIIAAAQVGRHNGGKRVSYGRSLVVDPWGKVVLELKGVREDGEEAEEGAVGQLGVVEVDLDEWERVREKMPLVRRTLDF
ncbi:Uu.00g068650.m01.CDS01 [Anthostomella pinea]|uniref:Uu.00g068650.m01.CDS01 n=1 Tax=Anthostomella pinea TaxID=933095 RepID=A0AAI8YNJ1_9PEZI|nr:Uu.00g068650.m01.CDS01 [Anthostomella pinea]